MQATSTQQNVIDRMFGWWYAIAAPPTGLEITSRRQGISVRKGRYTSLVLLVEMIDTLLTYFVKATPQLIVSLSVSALMLCVGVYLNRIGRTSAAGWLVVITIEAGMIAHFLSLGLTGPGLSLAILPQLILFVKPQLIAISLFPPKVSLPIGVLNCMFIAAAITFLPKMQEMKDYLSNASFDVYYTPIGTLILISLISVLWANCALREMSRADQSEEVSKLARDIMNNPILLKELLANLERKRVPFRDFADEEVRYQSRNDGWW